MTKTETATYVYLFQICNARAHGEMQAFRDQDKAVARGLAQLQADCPDLNVVQVGDRGPFLDCADVARKEISQHIANEFGDEGTCILNAIDGEQLLIGSLTIQRALLQ